jgi:hypothetical protein
MHSFRCIVSTVSDKLDVVVVEEPAHDECDRRYITSFVNYRPVQYSTVPYCTVSNNIIQYRASAKDHDLVAHSHL